MTGKVIMRLVGAMTCVAAFATTWDAEAACQRLTEDDDVFADALSSEDAAIETTVGEDAAGEAGASRDGDEDFLIFRAPF